MHVGTFDLELVKVIFGVIRCTFSKIGPQLKTALQICRVLLMPDCLSLVWGHFVHFAKFPILRFSKRYSFNSFIRFQPNFIQKYHNYYFFGSLTKLKKFWYFGIFVNTALNGTGHFKTLPLPQFSSYVSQTWWEHWATMVEYRLLLFLAIGQVLKILWHFKF